MLITTKKNCLWCGKPITDGVHTTENNDAFCCEGCYLGYMAGQRFQHERDEIQLSLVEALATALDAITSDRSYRKAQSFDAAKKEITNMSGQQFDPEGVEAFLAEEDILRGMVEVKCTLMTKHQQ